MATNPVEALLLNLKAFVSKVNEAMATKVPPVVLMSNPSATLPVPVIELQPNNPVTQVRAELVELH